MRIGIDLGGTKIEGVLLDSAGGVIAQRRCATPAENYQEICRVVAAMISELRSDTAGACDVGIGMPGALDSSGEVKNSNTVCLNGQRFQSDIENLLEMPVCVENDANCMVLSEIRDGAAAGAASAFGVIIGTGTGGGLIVHDRIVSGANGIGGEWGHNRVPWNVPARDTRPCYCGRADCVETYLSGRGLLATYRSVCDQACERAEQLSALAVGGDQCAQTAIRQYVDHLARALAVVINVVDPEVVVLAGGLSKLPSLPEQLGRAIQPYIFTPDPITRFVLAKHGPASGVRGAAFLTQ